MKVYAIHRYRYCAYETGDILAVFSTLEAAEKHVEQDKGNCNDFHNYQIIEKELDNPPGVAQDTAIGVLWRLIRHLYVKIGLTYWI